MKKRYLLGLAPAFLAVIGCNSAPPEAVNRKLDMLSKSNDPTQYINKHIVLPDNQGVIFISKVSTMYGAEREVCFDFRSASLDLANGDLLKSTIERCFPLSESSTTSKPSGLNKN
jgi:hypothetical protein